MKKVLAIMIAVLLLSIALVGCSAEPCEVCGEADGTNKAEIAGESAYLCDDCYALFDLGASVLDGAGIDLDDLY